MFGKKDIVVPEFPLCDFCLTIGKHSQSVVHGRTTRQAPSNGRDANMCQEHADMHGKAGRMARLVLHGATLVLVAFLGCAPVYALDMVRIAQIESSGNPLAVGRGGDIGLYQITPILLRDYNRFNPGFTRKELFDAHKNTQVASWYLMVRLPALLRHYHLGVNDRRILVAYNAGIKTLRKHRPLPSVTVRYLRKYFR